MLIPPSTFKSLCDARQMLRADDMPGDSIAAIASKVGLSTGYFIRVFARVFGITPHQYRKMVRLRLATHALAFDHGSVTEVCLHVGYSSPSTFTESFRQHTGKAPQRFQQEHHGMGRQRAQTVLIPGCIPLMGQRNFEEASGER